MVDQYIIAESGSHGTGKTTATLNRAVALKKELPDKRVGYYSENVAFCPYPINRKMTEESQLWIFTNQIQAELNLLTRYDIIISDRTIIDCIAYTQASGFHKLARAMTIIAQHHMQRYSEINFHLIENNPWMYDDTLRDTDTEFRQHVEDTMLLIYSQLGYTTNHLQFNTV